MLSRLQIGFGWPVMVLSSVPGLCQSAAPLAVNLSFENGSVPLHAPIEATLQLHNTGNYTYKVQLGLDDKQAFTFRIQEPSGATNMHKINVEDGLHTPGVHFIKPGEVYKQELIVNEWFNFPSQGTYQLRLMMQANVEQVQRSRLVRMRPLERILDQIITVLPYDSAYLSQQCQALVARMRSTDSADEVTKAADELMSVQDAVAAPYLAQAARDRPALASDFIASLKMIGTREAVESLFDLGRSTNVETKALALGALHDLELTTHDTDRRSQIRSLGPL